MAGEPLERKSFSGGFTDQVYGGGPNQFAYNDNLLIDLDEKIFSRPGSTFVVAALPQISTGAQRITRFIKFNDESRYFLAAGPALEFLSSPTTWGTPLVLPRTTGTHLSWAEWRGHLLLTYDDLSSRPSRVSSPTLAGAPIIDLVGLPAVTEPDNFVPAAALASAISLANIIRANMIVHFGSVVHHKIADTASPALLTTVTSIDLPTLLALTGQMLKAHRAHSQASQAADDYHLKEKNLDNLMNATEVAQTLTSTKVPETLLDAVERLNDLKRAWNTHLANSEKHITGPGTGFVGSTAFVTTAFLFGVNTGPSFPTASAGLLAYAQKINAALDFHFSASVTNPDTLETFDAHENGTDPGLTFGAPLGDTLADTVFNVRFKYDRHDVDAEDLPVGYRQFHRQVEESDHSLTRRAYWGLSQYVVDALGGILPGDYLEMADVLNEVKNSFNEHVYDQTIHYTATGFLGPAFDTPGEKAVQLAREAVSGNDIQLATYLYAFVLFKEHVANADTFDDFGPVLLRQALNVISVENTPLVISNIPLPSDVTHKTVIYRTSNGGVSFFKVGEVASNVSTFTDGVSDTELIDGEPIYTTGGVVENDPPPKCKYLHIVNETGYYGNVIDSLGVAYPNRVNQSLPGNPSASPEDFYVDLEDEVKGISSVRRSIPLVFCSGSIYRLEGQIDPLGRGSIVAESISNSVGLVSENSILKVDAGLLFAGTDGFYFTDGFQLQKLSRGWDNTYRAITSTAAKAANITGVYDPTAKRAFWGIQRDSANADNDQILSLDLNFPLGERACWSTWSNSTHFSPSALGVLSDEIIRLDTRGYWFKHQSALTEDPYVNTALAGAGWGTKTVLWDLQDCAADFGTTGLRKWGTKIDLCLNALTDLDLAVQTNIDRFRIVKALTPVSHTAPTYTAPVHIGFGSPSDATPKAGNFNFTRHFPANTLRFTHKQMRFTNDYVTLETSAISLKGTATVDNAAKTVTLDNLAKSWLSNSESYFISFAGDAFTSEYEIQRRNSNTVLTVLDPGNTLVNGSSAWVIRGFKKGQKLRMVSYTLYAQMMDSPESSAGDA